MLKTAADPRQSIAARVDALGVLSNGLCENEKVFARLIDMLLDKDEAIDVRLATLQTIQAASFASASFAACRPTFMKALRTVAKDDNFELRQRALGMLAREDDATAHDLLVAGVKDPAKALVPPEKALQLLSYYPKSDAYGLARDVLSNSSNEDARREALRLLGADTKAAPIIETVLRDKSQPIEIRQVAAQALHALAPDSLQAHAREMVMDAQEHPEMQAVGLTALTQFGNPKDVREDAALTDRARQLTQSAQSPTAKTGATRFLAKFQP